MEQYKTAYVLMVDDDEDDRSLFAEVFAKAAPHAKLCQASNGNTMLLQLDKPPYPDMIFLDLNMPRMSGFECLSFIRNNEATKDIPVIIYTTSYSDIDVEHAFHKGATFFLTKPANLLYLENAIRFLLPKNLKGYQANMREFVLGHPGINEYHR